MSPRLLIAVGVMLFVLSLVLANTLPISEDHQNWVLGVVSGLAGCVLVVGFEKRRKKKK